MLVEVGLLGLVAWKFTDFYDRHHGPAKFDDRLDRPDAIERYARYYLNRDYDG